MPHDRLQQSLEQALKALQDAGTLKGAEATIRAVVPAAGASGPRYLLEGHGETAFLRMNSNSYLGLSFLEEVRDGEEQAVRDFGTGPGAVRFISGTWSPHVALEARLARFHGREAAMIFSSAYATVLGTLVSLITKDTAVISDDLNHNCIINAIRMARPGEKHIYAHLDMAGLKDCLERASKGAKRALVITDGIFSMRGDHGPLDEIMEIAHAFDDRFAENVIVIADDSHGVGAFGETGRGTEEFTASAPVDLLIATLGKAFGVNGGYVTASAPVIAYLRESAPTYIYSNPITPGEAEAALRAVDVLDSERGRALLAHLRAMRDRFAAGLVGLGLETIAGAHPVVPLMVRDTGRTTALVEHLFSEGVLATGLNYPVVPKGDEEIRFQISADHTASDIDYALDVLSRFRG